MHIFEILQKQVNTIYYTKKKYNLLTKASFRNNYMQRTAFMTIQILRLT